VGTDPADQVAEIARAVGVALNIKALRHYSASQLLVGVTPATLSG
jgi:hypothetical protein